MVRRAARKDNNHADITQALTDAGCTVVELYQLGDGVPDILVGSTDLHTGVFTWLLVEVKTARGKLTDDEVAFHERLPDDAPMIVARSEEEILEWFGRL